MALLTAPGRRMSATLALLFLVVFLCQPLAAQQQSWQELNARVTALYAQGKYSEAIPLAQEALRQAEATFGPDDPNVATSLNNLAGLYWRQGKSAEAEPLLERALRIREKALGPEHPHVAQSLNNLAELYRNQGKHAEAESLHQRALRIREKALGPGSPDVAASLSNLAVLYQNQGKYSEAEPFLQRALSIRENVLGPEHPDVATVLNNLAELYRAQGKYAEAEPLYRRALRIDETALGPEHPDVASDLSNLAELYRAQRKYTEAEPLFQRALRIREKALGPEHPDMAKDLNNLALLYSQRGRYAEAEPLYQRSLRIYEKALGPEHPNLVLSLNNFAVLYRNQGRYAEAEPLYQRALRIYEKALGPEHPDVATALNNLAQLYDAQAKYVEAEPLYQRALRIYEKALGTEHRYVATSLNNLAALYKTQGRYAEAEPFFQRALRIIEKALGPEHPDVATALNNLAVLYYDQGKYAEAAALTQRALRIREKALGPEHAYVAATVSIVAELYRAQGKYAEAEPLMQRSLGINEKALGPQHPEVARALNNLAGLYEQQGKYREAEPLYQRALGIWEKALGSEHPDVAMSLNNLATLYDHQGKYAEAEPPYQRALRILEKALGPEHPYVGGAQLNLARLYHAQGLPTSAQPFFEKSFEVLEKQFEQHFSYMSEKERLGFLNTVGFRFPLYFSFVLRFREKNPALVGRMYDLVLWQKGFIVGSVAALRRQVEVSGDPEALKLLDQLAAKRTQIATLLGAQPADRAQWRKTLDQLNAEANDLERALVARSSQFAEQKKLERVTWQDVRNALKPGEAAVEFVRFEFYDGKKWTGAFYCVALVVRPESKLPEMVVLDDGTPVSSGAKAPAPDASQNGTPEGVPLRKTERALKDYRHLVGESAAPGAGQEFYRTFWQPLERALGNAKTVYLSPDGELNQVSLGLVPDASGKLLMEKYDLRLVSNTKDLLRPSHVAAGASALVVGNPKFLLGEEEQKRVIAGLREAEARKIEPQRAQRKAEGAELVLMASASLPPAPVGEVRSRGVKTRGECNPAPPEGGVLCPLPDTAVEVDTIASLLKKKRWQVEEHEGATALEEVVKATQHPRVVHLSTHGFFLSDQQIQRQARMGEGANPGLQDPMLRSGLFFAGADRVLNQEPPLENADDGVLTAYEATSLNLQGTELVVLSACDTGSGQTRAGEGVFGLRRALQVAGADSVLMSLWSVPDRETRELMTLFYQKWLSGKAKPAALREAQLAERAVVQKRYGKDLPYYWGAFVLVGR